MVSKMGQEARHYASCNTTLSQSILDHKHFTAGATPVQFGHRQIGQKAAVFGKYLYGGMTSAGGPDRGGDTG
jgi:hypothetical protein